eukprot:1013179-Ditylum_brightwellii.AAC.1
MMKSTGAKHITDTVCFHHHRVVMPTAMQTNYILKATKNLNKAISSIQRDAPPDYVDAVNKLCSVLLKEKPINNKQCTCAPSQPVEKPTTKTVEKESMPMVQAPQSPAKAPTAPEIPYVTNDELSDNDESVTGKDNNNCKVDKPPPPRYNLRMCANDSINSIIFEETPNVQQTTTDLVHQRRYSIAARCCKLKRSTRVVVDDETDKLLEYQDLIHHEKYRETWTNVFVKELDYLAKGLCGHQGTNTIKFIRKHDVPGGCVVTYARIVVDYRSQKADLNRVRLTVGGERIDYPWDVSTPTANLVTSKLLMNSTISTPGAKFMTVDRKNFYLNTLIDRYEYMPIAYNLLPKEIIEKYDLEELKTEDGWVYIKIQKGMYGLSQVDILANKLLTQRLHDFGYFPCTYTPGLWRHMWRPMTFCLVVNYFGVKYKGRENAEHLMNAIKQNYEVMIDWEGSIFCSIHLK